MSLQLIRGRRCAFESLENRLALAGNVVAQIVKGNLVITGDKSNNEVLITSAAVTGMGTTVNGTAAFTLPTGFAGSIKIDMKSGNDTALIGGIPVIKGLESQNTENVI